MDDVLNLVVLSNTRAQDNAWKGETDAGSGIGQF